MHFYKLTSPEDFGQAYVYRSGFARFTIAHFSIKKEELVNNLVHLTNFSIQKHAPAYKSKTGTKWSVSIHSNKECDQIPHAPMSPLAC
jgi:tubulin polyglutamylase TTLL9